MSFKVVANAGADNTATSTAGFAVAGIYNDSSGCSNYGSGATGNGWLLTDITNAAAGIPTTVTTPLSIQ